MRADPASDAQSEDAASVRRVKQRLLAIEQNITQLLPLKGREA